MANLCCTIFLYICTRKVYAQTDSSLLICGKIQTDEQPFGKMTVNTKLNQQHFSETMGVSAMFCMTQCLVRVHCNSFAYHRESLMCLLYDLQGNSSLIAIQGFVYSEIKTWPQVSFVEIRKNWYYTYAMLSPTAATDGTTYILDIALNDVTSGNYWMAQKHNSSRTFSG